MIDHIQDKNNVEFYRISLLNDIPDFVKEASLMSEKEASRLKSTEYADNVLRLFPIDSRANTWISAAYIKKQASEGVEIRQDVQDNLKEACALWDIDVDSICVKGIEKKASKNIKVAYKDDLSTYAVVPVNCGEHLDKVASDILTLGNHSYPIRRNVARQILGASKALDHAFPADVHISLEKVAGYGVSNIEHVLEATQQRKHCVEKTYPRHLDSLEVLEKYAKQNADAEGIVPSDVLDKVASVLDAVDRQTDMTHHYGKGFTCPEMQLFKVSLSQVDGYRDNLVKLANNRVFMKDSFNHNKVTEFLVNVFDKEANKLFENMQSLSSTDADRLAEYIDKHASDYEHTIQDVDELEVPENSPVVEEHIGDEQEVTSEKGQEVLEDEQTPKNPNNSDK